MLWVVIIVIAICAVKAWYNDTKESRASAYRSHPSVNSQNTKYVNMPLDAHDQVEALAQLIYVVYQDFPFAKNDSSKGVLHIYEEKEHFAINFWYDWDFSPAKRIITERFTLGEGFSFDSSDDMIRYKTTKVENVNDWCKNIITDKYYVDPVVATLQNNCPGLQIISSQVFDSGLSVVFRCA